MGLFKKSTQAVAEAVGKVAESAEGALESTLEASSRQANATKRQSIDMLSDNKLSKSIRPIILIWAMLLFSSMTVLDYCGIKVDDAFKTTITMVLGLGVTFYFPGRTLEKYLKQRKPRKTTLKA